MTEPYTKLIWRGHTFDYFTVAAIEAVEAKLGRQIYISQGSYNSSVGASGGTHAGGGAVDWSPAGWPNLVEAAREVGFAAWHRPAIPGLWGEHVHAVLNGNKMLSEEAKGQIAQYANGTNGLADYGPDNGPRNAKTVPLPVFKYEPDTKQYKAWIDFPGWYRLGWGRGIFSEGNLLIQASLAARGYAGAFHSGHIGKKWTTEAVSATHNYQVHHGLKAGPPNPATWDKLGILPTDIPDYPGEDSFILNAPSIDSLRLQAVLILNGYGPTLAQQATAIWRPRAATAVRNFQLSQEALKGDPDGIPGPLTWRLAFSQNK